MFKRSKRDRQPRQSRQPGAGRHRVGGKQFEHASGYDDPVAVIAEHSLPVGLAPGDVDVPHGYRSRSVLEFGDDAHEERKSA